MNTMLAEILNDSLYSLIIIGNFIAIIIGFGLLFAPAMTLKFNNKINMRISMRKATKKIETDINFDTFFYKHSKISGVILVVCASYILYSLVTFNAYAIITYLPKSIPVVGWEWIIESIQIFFYIACSFILIFGLIVFARPSLIKSFEETANSWVSTRQMFFKVAKDINYTDNLLTAHPRTFGAFISVFSLIFLYLLLPNYINA